jgi:hypothetical protein
MEDIVAVADDRHIEYLGRQWLECGVGPFNRDDLMPLRFQHGLDRKTNVVIALDNQNPCM